MTVSETIKSLFVRLKQTKDDEHKLVQEEYNTYFDSLTEEEQQEAKATEKEHLMSLYDEAVQIRREAELLTQGHLFYQGTMYEFGEWTTIKNYGLIHNVQLNTIMNWIKRGNIKPDDYVEIAFLNNLKLIRNKKYS